MVLSSISTSLLLVLLILLVGYGVYFVFVEPYFNPLRKLPGPPSNLLLEGRHMVVTMDPSRSPRTHEHFIKEYGRTVHIRGPLPWDHRLLTLDPVSLNHVLKNTSIYEKPWQSRALIESLIGRGMLAAEGKVHKRQKRVITPAFSIQNLRALVPLVFGKGIKLKEKWMSLIESQALGEKKVKFDVCDWLSRAAFDVIGSAGFDYQFNAIDNGDNELLRAYKDMFEIGISQQRGGMMSLLYLTLPFLRDWMPDASIRTVKQCKNTIHRVAGQLMQEKKAKILEAEKSGKSYGGRDLLTLLLKSNESVEILPDQRISDEDILNSINTFMFAGTDTTSLSITWTLVLLAMYPPIQTALRQEILSVLPPTPLDSLTEEEIESLYAIIADLPYLDKVMRETLRLVPPLHSSIRAATQDDIVPTSSPMKFRQPDGTIKEEIRPVFVPKGSAVHVPVEAFNLDKEIWGPDAWAFVPDRWDNLPEAVKSNPGLYSHMMTFSGGPRACIGLRFSIITMKSLLFTLLANFVFSLTEEKVGKANVVLTRPYVVGKQKEGSQCPLMVTPYIPGAPIS